VRASSQVGADEGSITPNPSFDVIKASTNPFRVGRVTLEAVDIGLAFSVKLAPMC
jgi:hypothetical protein